MTYQVAVAGASGYAGGEVLRLLADHPQLDVVAASAHSQAGEPITAVHPHLSAYGDRRFCETTPEALAGADLVVMTLPHGQSAALAAQLPADVKVVDLGADHRLEDADAWEAYYHSPHAGTWTYGLPELPGGREAIAASNRVAATGCYAVATTLALRPLVEAGIADPNDIVVVAASGTSGAGNAPKKHLLASEVVGSMSPYKAGAHQHVPEIKQATGAASLSMTPLLAPMPRGILSTVTAKPAGDVSAAEVRAALSKAYDAEHFVRLLPEGAWPATASTYGTNAVHLQGTVDLDSGRIIVCAAIDNLGKGAAGQVVQCANLMLGLPEASGLTVNGVAP
ncbi:N-acetyl-gamma-glutamyl-phosphate reductase [Glycomyces sp. L485]|uniref:N-acetyl-gamma-glutamyl-phosphate reductase n=1 Tax=Glycomyces sp. L485 TaxID=2909235 RepID=UPI001F4B9875|nr:N-acetyl-gamma-glutamyl-phosphate reductase [Glycomyces sp. L485]